MGMSLTVKVCCGVNMGTEEDWEPPWDACNEDITDWWRKVNGYKPPFQLWDENGNYVEGKTEADYTPYSEHERQWDKQHPCPIEVVHYGVESYTGYIFTIPGTTNSEYYDVLPLNIDEMHPDKIGTLKAAHDFSAAMTKHSLWPKAGSPVVTWLASASWG